MKEVSKDFYSRNNARTYNEKVQGSSSYDSSTGKTTVTHYEDKK
jgi:hypothetical protein